MAELGLLAVFLTGLLGGVHCAGMCGGIVGALALQSPRVSMLHLLAYNAGRIASYTAAGVFTGAAGMLLGSILPLQQALYIFANLMLVALGLYIAGLWHGLARLETAGGRLWQHVQPLTKKLMSGASTTRALLLGSLWGWLPCGLVYSVLVTALASGSAINGGLTMLAFGLGTVPNLVAMGYFAASLRPLMQKPGVRIAAGLLIIGLGVLGLMRSGQPIHHHGDGPFADRAPGALIQSR
jgi:uncharacterized protein